MYSIVIWAHGGSPRYLKAPHFYLKCDETKAPQNLKILLGALNVGPLSLGGLNVRAWRSCATCAMVNPSLTVTGMYDGFTATS